MRRGRKIALFALLGTFTIVMAAYVMIAVHYKDRFLKGSFINNIDYSGKTVEEVEEDIAGEIAAYQLNIFGRDGVEDTICAEDMGYHYVSDGQIRALKEKQNPLLWPFSYFNEDFSEMAATCEYDEEKLKETINELLFFKEDVVKAPKDAEIVYNDNGYQLIEEEMGTTLDKKKVIASIKDKIDTSESSLFLEEENLYLAPTVLSEQPKVKKALKKLKKYTELTITYDFGDRTEVLDKNILHDWVSVDEDFNVVLDKQRVVDYVNYLGYYYTTFASTRDFKRYDGKVIKVKGGDYGWIINRSEEVEELYQVILKGKSVTREPVYSQTAKSRNKNDIGSTYIEINLKKQKVFLFVEGKKILSTPVVTGSKIRSYETPPGIYQITYKERDATLNGEDYSSPVSYWMPFNKNIGLHDASWRKEFGKDIYEKNGSHGCVNMPPDKAKKLYENIEKGTPVVVY